MQCKTTSYKSIIMSRVNEQLTVDRNYRPLVCVLFLRLCIFLLHTPPFLCRPIQSGKNTHKLLLEFLKRVDHGPNLCEMTARFSLRWTARVEHIVVVGDLIVPQLNYVFVIDFVAHGSPGSPDVDVLSVVIVVGVVLERTGRELVKIPPSKPLQRLIIFLLKSTERGEVSDTWLHSIVLPSSSCSLQ